MFKKKQLYTIIHFKTLKYTTIHFNTLEYTVSNNFFSAFSQKNKLKGLALSSVRPYVRHTVSAVTQER
jgi:hypothetical protein